MNSNKLWNDTLLSFKETINGETFNEIFESSPEIYKTEHNVIYIIVQNPLSKYRIDKFYLTTLSEIASSINGEKVQIRTITKEEVSEKEKEKADIRINAPSSMEKRGSTRKLRSEFTFSNFEVGESNRLSWVWASKFAENENPPLNPLFIFGNVGIGKTHLIMAIGNYIIDNNPSANVVYTTAQEFCEDYFMAGKYSTYEDFYNHYQSADVLLVDDIQFIEGKDKSQEEFFKLFEILHRQNKRIVVASDRPTTKLKKVADRLISRLNWGLTVDVLPPDKNLRISILKRKLTYLISNYEDVPLETLELIADFFPNNVRDLEGALNRFIMYCVSMEIPFTVENALIALEPLIPQNQKSFSKSSEIDNLIDVLCSYYRITKDDICSNSRKQTVAYARQMAIYLIRTKYNVQFKEIGSVFGGRDHATIMYSFEKMEGLLKDDAMVRLDLENINKKLSDF